MDSCSVPIFKPIFFLDRKKVWFYMKKKLMSLSVQNTCLPTYLLSLTFFLEVIKWDSTVLCFKSADLSITILCHTFQLILDIH